MLAGSASFANNSIVTSTVAKNTNTLAKVDGKCVATNGTITVSCTNGCDCLALLLEILK